MSNNGYLGDNGNIGDNGLQWHKVAVSAFWRLAETRDGVSVLQLSSARKALRTGIVALKMPKEDT